MFLSSIKNINVTVTFLLELGVLIALGYYGFVVGPSPAIKFLLGLGLPLLAVVVWWLFGAPGAIWHLKGVWRLLLLVIFFGAGALALFVSGQRAAGIIFALIFVINTALIYGLGVPEWAKI